MVHSTRRTTAVWAAGAVVVATAMAAGGVASSAATALASLVDAERAFARMSVATSQRDAFLANFDDEGVFFTPAPANAKEALGRQSPTPAAAARVLDWDPVTGDVAVSGDLGYTTGPWIASERASGTTLGKKLGTGWFFSVWRRKADAGWRVLMDFGVDAPHARVLRAQTFRRAAVRAFDPKGQADQAALADALRAADVSFALRVSSAGWADALRGNATADVMTFRQGHEPASGVQEATTLLRPGPLATEWKPSTAVASTAGDLGVTHGSYAEGTGPAALRGYYLHVWKRQSSGWKLAVDVTNVER